MGAITLETVNMYLAKCRDGLKQVRASLASAKDDVHRLELSEAAILAQIETLEGLKDFDGHAPAVEIPTAGKSINDLFAKRKGDPDLPDEQEMRKLRQEHVYKREALEAVEALDASNKEDQAREDSPVDPS